MPARSPKELLEADLCLLAVPDQVLGVVAAQTAPLLRADAGLVHCAGALSLEALGSGGARGSFHPLVAISDPHSPLAGASVAVSASSPRLEAQLRRVAGALQMKALRVREEQRALYHACAVLGSSGLVALLAGAAEGLQRVGLSSSEALGALVPLASSALNGLDRVGLPRAFTGPVVRADAATLRQNLLALPAELRPVYRELTASVIAGVPLPLATKRRLCRAIGR
jgi:predicted short-subunit dehydrogenase-like oxidoreductase (DUF2520 family)